MAARRNAHRSISIMSGKAEEFLEILENCGEMPAISQILITSEELLFKPEFGIIAIFRSLSDKLCCINKLGTNNTSVIHSA